MFDGLPPLLQLIIGVLLICAPVALLVWWFFQQPKTSREWLDEGKPTQGNLRLRIALTALGIILLVEGVDTVHNAWQLLQ